MSWKSDAPQLMLSIRAPIFSWPELERKYTVTRTFSCLLLFAVLRLQWSAAEEDQGLSVHGSNENEGPVIPESDPPEAMFKRSYLILPQQRLVHSQRQSGKDAYHLSPASALCSSLTGPDCLYRAVMADPNHGMLL
jgi:hypothetical protein